MSKEEKNPKQDWGFYISTPRVVRTHYKELTLVEKWLYVCLKDLCGDTGTCYRTLRVLAEETDLSTGTLSTGIRHLHEAGLIHAEKKRRSNNVTGKEVWHITIVDIWQENAKAHPTVKRSPDEQQCSRDEHSNENVQEMNNNVQEMNIDDEKRSGNEQQCSNFDDRSNNNKGLPITEAKPEKQEQKSNTQPPQELVPPHVGTAGAPSLFEEEEPQPTAPPNVSARGKKPATGKRKGVRDLSAIAPVPPPEKPEPVSPFTVQVCLALADHYRGYVLTNGSYGMMQNEAIAIVRRGITYERLDRVYRYMKGLDKKEDGTGLYDEYWEDKTFDLLHVNKHLEAKEKEMRKKVLQQRSAGKQREASPPTHIPPRMPSDAELRKQVY